MTTTTEDTYEKHKNQLQTDQVYATAWKQKEILVNEAWDAGRSKEDRRNDLRKSAVPEHAIDRTLENKRREIVIREAKEFHKAYDDNPQAVLDDLKEKWQAREQAIPKAPENASVLDKTQIAEAGLEKTAAAQKGQSHDYSALQNKPPEKRPDPLTKEGRDAIREQRKAESGLEKYGQNQGNDLHHYRFLKTRDDGGRER